MKQPLLVLLAKVNEFMLRHTTNNNNNNNASNQSKPSVIGEGLRLLEWILDVMKPARLKKGKLKWNRIE